MNGGERRRNRPEACRPHRTRAVEGRRGGICVLRAGMSDKVALSAAGAPQDDIAAPEPAAESDKQVAKLTSALDDAAELEEEGFYEEAIEACEFLRFAARAAPSAQPRHELVEPRCTPLTDMEALASGLDPCRCHHGAARCYEELSDAEAAARECTECLRDNPNCCSCLTTRGWQV